MRWPERSKISHSKESTAVTVRSHVVPSSPARAASTAGKNRRSRNAASKPRRYALRLVIGPGFSLSPYRDWSR